jgi:ATP-dependent Clp protease, protease subunit
MRKWYEFRAAAKSDERELLIYDEIGNSYWNDKAVTAEQFMKDLQALPSSVRTIVVRINSPGGSCFDAVAISNALREQRMRLGRTVRVCIDGIAASAATVVACAGSPIQICDNAIYMIHMPWALEIGTADDMRKTAESLDRVRDSIVATYRQVSPKTDSELVEMMKAETWMGPEDAKQHGFVTEIVPAVWSDAQANVRQDLAATWKNAPAKQLQRVAATVRGGANDDIHGWRRAFQRSASPPKTVSDIARDYYGRS